MPVPIIREFRFTSTGGTIWVRLRFETLLLCNYSLTLREAGSNNSVLPKPYEGDNSNPDDDLYDLPMPASVNNNRSLWATVAIIDQTGQGGDYEVIMEVTQDGHDVAGSPLTTGRRSIDGNSAIEILVARLIS